VIRKIPVGKRPVEVLRATETEEIYVLNRESKSISVIDPLKQEAILTIPLQYAPRCMAAASNSEHLYVSYGEGYGEITVLEMAGQKLVRSDSVPVILTER
jgi:DNA-binding beta-propeller fold protein YncE